MPLPLGDVTQAYRSAPEKTDQALTKVSSALRFPAVVPLQVMEGLLS